MTAAKRGDIHSQPIITFLIAIFIIFIMWFGFHAIQKVVDAQCQSELAQFITTIETIGNNIRHGTVQEETLILPCNADQIIFTETGIAPDPTIQK